jgi:hypothetical protein
MDKLAKYRECVKSLLTRYGNEDVAESEVEIQLIFDDKHDHYQSMNVGWKGLKRVYRCIIHFDIKDEKIWLQQNLTDQNPVQELVAMGVAREDIVLGLQPAYKRQYDEKASDNIL